MKIEIGTNEAGQRVDKFCRKLFKDVPLSAIYKSIRKGDVKLNGKKTKEKYVLQEGDILSYTYIEHKIEAKKFQRVEPNIKIGYEDTNMVIIEKWPGVLIHANKPSGDPTLTDYALSYLFNKGEYDPEKEITFTPAPCNRLDRNTSGLVIFGKNYDSLKTLNKMIKDRDIKKYYLTLVKGRIKDGIYNAYILKNEENNVSKVFNEEKPNTKLISMDVKCLETCGTFSLLEIELITGRSHQLRAHLSFLGNPIVGDDKYGDRKLNSFFCNKYGLSYQYLFAYKLKFTNCPENLDYMQNKTITESIPPIFKKIKKDIFKF